LSSVGNGSFQTFQFSVDNSTSARLFDDVDASIVHHAHRQATDNGKDIDWQVSLALSQWQHEITSDESNDTGSNGAAHSSLSSVRRVIKSNTPNNAMDPLGRVRTTLAAREQDRATFTAVERLVLTCTMLIDRWKLIDERMNEKTVAHFYRWIRLVVFDIDKQE
jgi:hypothetical protein